MADTGRDIAGKGDPVRILELLWGKAQPQRRGPKPKYLLEDVLKVAVSIADAEGLEKLTTRRVAEELGISPMSLYTYVPGKAELIDLMLDYVAKPGGGRPEGWAEMGWRARLEILARAMWGFYLSHPWMMQVETHRPSLGPNTLAAYETALSAVDGIGLTEIEMDYVVTLVMSYVAGAVRNAAREAMVNAETGMTDEQWWRRIEPFLETIDYSPYPITSRVGPVTGEAYGAHDPMGAFEFGLARMLDGLALLIEPRLAALTAES